MYKRVNASDETYYVGKLYELRLYGHSGVAKNVYYVYAGKKLVAIHESATGVGRSLKYVLTDRLGGVNVITDATGKELERINYDAFGGIAGHPTQSTRGYTGHEWDAESGLINMNARLYDPVLGRFISADTVIPEPGNMQAYNRYGYVLNNPLYYTDPSGHFFFAIAALIMTTAAESMIAAFAIAAVTTYIITQGDLKASLIAGASAGASFGIGDCLKNISQGLTTVELMERSVVLHAVKGGLVSLASGENFVSGALSAGITAGMGNILGVIENNFGQIVGAGIIGGVAATAGGGKFMTGFMTGAFTHALNWQKHEGKRLTRWVKQWKEDGLVEKPISEWKTNQGGQGWDGIVCRY